MSFWGRIVGGLGQEDRHDKDDALPTGQIKGEDSVVGEAAAHDNKSAPPTALPPPPTNVAYVHGSAPPISDGPPPTGFVHNHSPGVKEVKDVVHSGHHSSPFAQKARVPPALLSTSKKHVAEIITPPDIHIFNPSISKDTKEEKNNIQTDDHVNDDDDYREDVKDTPAVMENAEEEDGDDHVKHIKEECADKKDGDTNDDNDFEFVDGKDGDHNEDTSPDMRAKEERPDKGIEPEQAIDQQITGDYQMMEEDPNDVMPMQANLRAVNEADSTMQVGEEHMPDVTAEQQPTDDVENIVAEIVKSETKDEQLISHKDQSSSSEHEEEPAPPAKEEEKGLENEPVTDLGDVTLTKTEPIEVVAKELKKDLEQSKDLVAVGYSKQQAPDSRAIVPAGRFVFLSDQENVSKNLRRLQEQTVLRRLDFLRTLHQMECRLGAMNAQLAGESMDRDLALRDFFERAVSDPLEAVVERIMHTSQRVIQESQCASPNTNSNNEEDHKAENEEDANNKEDTEADAENIAKTTLGDLQRRVSLLDTKLTEHVHVGLPDIKADGIDSAYLQLERELLPEMRMEASKANKREGSINRRFESIAGDMCRQFREEYASWRATVEMAKSEEQMELSHERAEHFLAQIKAMRNMLQKERAERQAQDKKLLQRIVQTNEAMKRTLLRTVEVPR